MNFETLEVEIPATEVNELPIEQLQPFLYETDISGHMEYLGSIEELSEEAWCELTPTERLDTLKGLEARLAEIQGREPRLVVSREYATEGQGIVWGHYDHMRPTEININAALLETPQLRLQAIHTLAHEGRHAFQHDVVLGEASYNLEVSAYWKANWDNYLNAQKFGFEIYRSQPVELDANSFADRIVSGIEEIHSNAEMIVKRNGWEISHLFDSDTIDYFGLRK